jgi:hypothetical protein
MRWLTAWYVLCEIPVWGPLCIGGQMDSRSSTDEMHATPPQQQETCEKCVYMQWKRTKHSVRIIMCCSPDSLAAVPRSPTGRCVPCLCDFVLILRE